MPLPGTVSFLFACKLAESDLCGRGPVLTFPTGPSRRSGSVSDIPGDLQGNVGHVLAVGLAAGCVMGCLCHEVPHAAHSGVPPLELHPSLAPGCRDP